MYPGINPRQMRMAMQKMGIQQEEIEAEEVIIRLKDKEIVISNPQVARVNMMGQKSYQISGEEEERPLGTSPDISDEDIETVAGTAGVTKEQARAAIEEHDGDLAAAIMGLKQ
jgi:nascent polypeptide-associated complex subunit alpha